ncbi:MAG: hypothetical protein KA419_02455 [Acidobacteria bacterium]|nr:hypothetical protein [Acidobacteriota bacterium]
MNCGVHEGEIAGFVTGDLEPDRMAAFERHAAGCAACAAQRAEYELDVHALRALGAPEISDADLEALRVGVHRALDPKVAVFERNRPASRARWWLTAAAVFAFAAFGAWLVFRPGGGALAPSRGGRTPAPVAAAPGVPLPKPAPDVAGPVPMAGRPTPAERGADRRGEPGPTGSRPVRVDTRPPTAPSRSASRSPGSPGEGGSAITPPLIVPETIQPPDLARTAREEDTHILLATDRPDVTIVWVTGSPAGS